MKQSLNKPSIILNIFIGLIFITIVILFIIGLRLYIINKNKDQKKENLGRHLMIPGALLIIILSLLQFPIMFSHYFITQK